MRFEWDSRKDARNRVKHGIRFETARLVFDDPFAVSVSDHVVEGEERWQTLGMVGGVVLLVAHTSLATDGEEAIRIISARKATPRERRIYEEAQ